METEKTNNKPGEEREIDTSLGDNLFIIAAMILHVQGCARNARTEVVMAHLWDPREGIQLQIPTYIWSNTH